MKAMITLDGRYSVDFNVAYSIATLLGFKKTSKLIGVKRWTGEYVVDINQISSLIVMCDIVQPSFLNGKPTSFIYNCILDVEPGYKFIDTPLNLTYIPLANNLISRIDCWVLDQNCNAVDFNGENLEIELKLVISREKKAKKSISIQ